MYEYLDEIKKNFTKFSPTLTAHGIVSIITKVTPKLYGNYSYFKEICQKSKWIP